MYRTLVHRNVSAFKQAKHGNKIHYQFNGNKIHYKFNI